MDLTGTSGRCRPCYVTMVRKTFDDVIVTGRFSIVQAKVAKFFGNIKLSKCFDDLNFGPESMFWTLNITGQ